MREGSTKAQMKKQTNKLQDNTHPLSSLPHLVINQPPQLSHHPTICNKYTMDIEFLVQMRQSNKRGSVRNDDTFNLHLGSGAG